MVSRQAFRRLAAGATLLLLVEIATASSGVLGWSGSITLNKVWELAASIAAILAWAWSAWKHEGPQRWSRWWMTASIASFTIALITWTWGQVIKSIPMPPATLGPAGFLLTPVLALLALIVRAYGRGSGHRSPLAAAGRTRLVRTLDLAIIGSSVLLFVSVTLGEQIARSWERTGPTMTVSVALPLSYLLLTAGIVVLARIRPSTRDLQVLFVAMAAMAYVGSSTLWAQWLDLGRTTIPPWLEAGWMAYPVLFFLAALAPTSGEDRWHVHARVDARNIVQVAVPYLPLIATVLFLAALLASGITLNRQQEVTLLALLGVVILRQLVTLAENNCLLGRAEYEALHDPLTGVANRTLFLYQLERSLALREDTRKPLVLAFCDMDDFKKVNDTLGHAAGDLVLKETANRLEHCVTGDDLVARLGGDEFAIVLQDVHEPLDDLGQRFLDAMQQPHLLNGQRHVVSASIGIACICPGDASTNIDEFVRWADTTMYAAKKRGKNTLAHTLESQEEPPDGKNPCPVAWASDPQKTSPRSTQH